MTHGLGQGRILWESVTWGGKGGTTGQKGKNKSKQQTLESGYSEEGS